VAAPESSVGMKNPLTKEDTVLGIMAKRFPILDHKPIQPPGTLHVWDHHPVFLSRLRFAIVDMIGLRSKETTQQEEDAKIFRAIALAGCPPGCLLVEDHAEVIEGHEEVRYTIAAKQSPLISVADLAAIIQAHKIMEMKKAGVLVVQDERPADVAP